MLTGVQIVEKESGVLGYPRETSGPLDADHHTVCKYSGPEDQNFILVRDALKMMASKIAPDSTSVFDC